MTGPVKIALLTVSGLAVTVVLYIGTVLVYADIQLRELFESEDVVAVPFDPDGWTRQGASHDGTRHG